MILRNIRFENDLPLEEDYVSSLQISSPHLYARVVQSFLALESGETPLEKFLFLEQGEAVDASKLLSVVSDPFQIDFSGKKFTTALYGEINRLIQREPMRQGQWERQMIQLMELIQTVCRDMPLEVAIPDEMTVQDACKAFGVQLDCPCDTSPLVRICKFMDIHAEWMPKKLLVLCNMDNYFSDEDWQEIIKYACYTKVKLLLVFRDPGLPINTREIRWQIDQNFDDRIIRV